MLDNIEIELCAKEMKHIIANLAQFYFYDLLQSSQFADYKLQPNGLFEKMPYFDNYWEEKERYPYLIKQSELSIGFALVHDITIHHNADWKMAEFFLLAPFRKKGIAQYAVNNIMKRHQGLWEISVLKDNEIAKKFWGNIFPDASNRIYDQYPTFIVYETVSSNDT